MAPFSNDPLLSLLLFRQRGREMLVGTTTYGSKLLTNRSRPLDVCINLLAELNRPTSLIYVYIVRDACHKSVRFSGGSTVAIVASQ
jgi:hypothetical protein